MSFAFLRTASLANLFAISACAAAFLALGGTADAGPITVTGNNTYAEARDPDHPDYWNFDEYSGVNPDDDDDMLAEVGASSSATSVTFTEFGGVATFGLEVLHERSGTLYATGLTSSTITFTADEANLSYSLASNYSNTRGTSDLYVYFVDLTAGVELFYGAKGAQSSNPESLVLGQPGGNLADYESGLLDGPLIHGHEYSLQYQTYTIADSADAGAIATGNLTLTVGPSDSSPQPVPEPSSLALLSIGGVIGAVRLRRRQAAA